MARSLLLSRRSAAARWRRGAGFDGLKPSGTLLDPVVEAADAAIATGSIKPLIGLVPSDRLDELQHRLDAALAARDFPVDDVEAGRRYIATYVAFFTYAEGEEHHHGDHEHGPVEHAHRH